MSIGLTIAFGFCIASLLILLIGMLHPRFSRTLLAITASALMFLPGFLLFIVDAPLHLVGIDGEEGYGFAFLSFVSLLVGIVAITLALLARSKLKNIEYSKEEF